MCCSGVGWLLLKKLIMDSVGVIAARGDDGDGDDGSDDVLQHLQSMTMPGPLIEGVGWWVSQGQSVEV